MIGAATFSILDTDYDTYAGLFTCQKLPFSHRQSATILSRTPKLDKTQVDKLRQVLSQNGVDPKDLDIITQSRCEYITKPGDRIQISVRNNFGDDEEEEGKENDVWLP